MKPLEGIRILDLSRQFAGAGGTRILATLGAEVIKIEWPEAPAFDFIREMVVPPELEVNQNRGGLFNGMNVEKRSFTLNMTTDDGKAIMKDLVAMSNMVFDNMTPRVMKNWGLDYEGLCEVRPDIVAVSCSGYGQTGPWANFRSYGMPSAAHTGLVHMVGEPGQPPAGWGFQIGDSHGMTNAAMWAMAGLYFQRVSGRGVNIDAAQTQGNIAMLAQFFLQNSVNGTVTRRDDWPPGNKRMDPPIAPHNAYPCLGSDTWCAITVHSEGEWANLKAAMGQPAWVNDERFATMTSRYEHSEGLDEALGAWTSGIERYTLARRLQNHGVRAGVVQSVRDRMEWDAQLAHRKTYGVYEHAEVGPRRHETVAAKFSDSPYVPDRAAPLMGEDNMYVLRDLLGKTPDEIDRLAGADVVRMAGGEQ
jgi:crotonobetainyl-CoA:carnitine CoA-transferase CaiB-like acyl-CoA transferase